MHAPIITPYNHNIRPNGGANAPYGRFPSHRTKKTTTRTNKTKKKKKSGCTQPAFQHGDVREKGFLKETMLLLLSPSNQCRLRMYWFYISYGHRHVVHNYLWIHYTRVMQHLIEYAWYNNCGKGAYKLCSSILSILSWIFKPELYLFWSRIDHN